MGVGMTSRTYLDDNGNACHVHAPDALQYTAMVKDYGCRKWRIVGDYKTKEEAAQAMLDAFMASPRVKRAIVLACYAWYEPSQCMKLVR